MIAKYPGYCRACNKPIKRGETINFFGKGHAEHASCGKIENREAGFYSDRFDMQVEDNMRDACGISPFERPE